MLSKMTCPNCPGPKVPHHCRNRNELSLSERLAALNQNTRRGVPSKRLSLVPPPKSEFAPSNFVRSLSLQASVHKANPALLPAAMSELASSPASTASSIDAPVHKAVEKSIEVPKSVTAEDSASACNTVVSTRDFEASSDAGESSDGSVLCARDFESSLEAGESSLGTDEHDHRTDEADSEAGESSIESVLCARDFESDCEICELTVETGETQDLPGDVVCVPCNEEEKEPRICPKCCERPADFWNCQNCHGKGEASTCRRCQGTGRYLQPCRTCSGTGIRNFEASFTYKSCHRCDGTGKFDAGQCNACRGERVYACADCEHGVPLCAECIDEKRQRRLRAHMAKANAGPPAAGVKISACSAGDLSTIKNLWAERRMSIGEVESAWSIENPLLSFTYHKRRADLKKVLGREADELQGFHGTHPDNVISISSNGFDSGRRCGQAFGAGEYFAKCPDVSEGYCKGGNYMMICRLSLGVESFSTSNSDGDHIWVPQNQYYVISEPSQILPVFVVKFHARYGGVRSSSLENALSKGYCTMRVNTVVEPVPANRPCCMSQPSTNALWMGFLHAHLSDESLERDVRVFLVKHAAEYCGKGLRLQIVRGKYKKAHVQLPCEMPRDVVHGLNKAPFLEDGKARTICVEDAHGSPQQRCPRWIASYCRGQNLRFTHPCFCSHQSRATDGASFNLVKVDLHSAKGNEIVSKFEKSAPFHDGSYPRVTAIHAVQNDVLTRLHEEYRRYLTQKNRAEPQVRELYHGTNNNILRTLYTHGLQPPSDTKASDACPVSGGKGLCTSLCNNNCEHCTERHEWDRCHMFGLGIYLADMAQKSHRYCSQPEVRSDGRRVFKMVSCSVLGSVLEIAGHLTSKDVMHDVPNVRSLAGDLKQMIEPVRQGARQDTSVEQHDLLFVKGLGCDCRPGFSVFNSEYIAFHPHQCLPRYQITYEV